MTEEKPLDATLDDMAAEIENAGELTPARRMRVACELLGIAAALIRDDSPFVSTTVH